VLLWKVYEEIKKMSGSLDDLTAQVSASDNVMQSAITLIQGLAAKLSAAGTDPAALQALSSSLQSNAQALAAAVAANTPSQQSAGTQASQTPAQTPSTPATPVNPPSASPTSG
jgi:peptidoglycan hydrolase CwlO-like protein